MLIRIPDAMIDPPGPGDITPMSLVMRRRQVLQSLAGAGALGWAGGAMASAAAGTAASAPGRLSGAVSRVPGASVMDKPTAFEDASRYNNFYEFGLDKSDPARHAHRLKTQPWTVTVEGLVHKPGRWAMEDLLKLAPMEERIYRLRCVEGWSMVIPWVGYSLAELIRRVEPMGGAKFVEFITAEDRNAMPGLRSGVLDWPYREGLRLDEALHPLTLLAFGMYGQVLPNQNGAPLRLVVPWKYGFKSGKSIVRIRFTEQPPQTSWVQAAPQEYGFYSNVNPNVDHPRWSQATERRIGEDGLLAKKRKTLMFNGYEPQVGQLYAGMDLKKFF